MNCSKQSFYRQLVRASLQCFWAREGGWRADPSSSTLNFQFPQPESTSTVNQTVMGLEDMLGGFARGPSQAFVWSNLSHLSPDIQTHLQKVRERCGTRRGGLLSGPAGPSAWARQRPSTLAAAATSAWFPPAVFFMPHDSFRPPVLSSLPGVPHACDVSRPLRRRRVGECRSGMDVNPGHHRWPGLRALAHCHARSPRHQGEAAVLVGSRSAQSGADDRATRERRPGARARRRAHGCRGDHRGELWCACVPACLPSSPLRGGQGARPPAGRPSAPLLRPPAPHHRARHGTTKGSVHMRGSRG